MYASTPTFGALRILLLFALALGLMINTFDVSTAFLHAPIEGKGGYTNEVYVIPPPEYLQSRGLPPDSIAWKLKKAMYGLRGAPRAFQEYLQETMEKLGFERCRYESCVYRHTSKKMWILTYVDDFSLVGLKKLEMAYDSIIDKMIQKVLEDY